ncbi:MAG: hypothetical protein ACD_45C00123G0008 [uncultured bacterium]|nr:MAG: hypothetical protein ACD_45C00123G0008 [uncultured bacterium]
MAVNKPCGANAFAIANVPVWSMLAAIMGTPRQTTPAFLKRISRSSTTSDLDFNTLRFGRIKTSLKSSLTSYSIRMMNLS